MRCLCKVASSVLFFALFAVAQEAPLILPNDSSSIAPPAPPAPPTATYQPVAPAIAPEKCDCSSSNIYEKNLRTAVYLHPLPLFWGAAYDLFMLNSTIEIPLSLSNSMIFQPTVWAGSSDGYVPILEELEYKNLIRAGSGIGIRRYARDRGQGFYLQAMLGIYYLSAKSLSYKEEDSYEEYDDDYYYYRTVWDPKVTTWKKVRGVVCDLVLYAGFAHKWQNINLFYEGGLGFGYDGTRTQQVGYNNKLVLSFNLGLGLPL